MLAVPTATAGEDVGDEADAEVEVDVALTVTSVPRFASARNSDASTA
jgi:hypothetical protein